MEYRIVHDSDMKAFIETINELLKGGWELSGSLAVSADGGDTDYFYQAMIKRVEPVFGFGQEESSQE